MPTGGSKSGRSGGDTYFQEEHVQPVQLGATSHEQVGCLGGATSHEQVSTGTTVGVTV